MTAKHGLFQGPNRQRFGSLTDSGVLFGFVVENEHSRLPREATLQRHELIKYTNFRNKYLDLLRQEQWVAAGLPVCRPVCYGS